jgi:hypothetical protein
LIWFAAPLLALGLTMYTRGLIYTLRPKGRMAEKRKKRNLKVGFTTDMEVFGRKVRRVGFLLSLVAGGLLAWDLSGEQQKEPAPAIAAP